MGCDILVFAPHPDDAELGMAATIARHSALGRRIVVADLSRGELASNADPETRRAEAAEAARLLGIAERVCLNLPDGAIGTVPEHTRAVVEAIRTYAPPIVAAPYWEDRHPDHPRTARLVAEAVFLAGLARYRAAGEPHRARRTIHYFIHGPARPDVVVDVDGHYDRKRAALAAYASQFRRGEGAVATAINEPAFLAAVEARDRQFGAMIGAEFGEGFALRAPARLDDLAVLAGRRPELA